MTQKEAFTKPHRRSVQVPSYHICSPLPYGTVAGVVDQYGPAFAGRMETSRQRPRLDQSKPGVTQGRKAAGPLVGQRGCRSRGWDARSGSFGACGRLGGRAMPNRNRAIVYYIDRDVLARAADPGPGGVPTASAPAAGRPGPFDYGQGASRYPHDLSWTSSWIEISATVGRA